MGQTHECQNRSAVMEEMLGVKVDVDDLNSFKAAVKRQLHNFISKRLPTAAPAGAKR